MQIIEIALRMNKTPEEIENISEYWMNRLLLYFEAETLAAKMN